MTPDALRKQTWLEYRAQVDCGLTRSIQIGVFVIGLRRPSLVGRRAHAGIDLKIIPLQPRRVRD